MRPWFIIRKLRPVFYLMAGVWLISSIQQAADIKSNGFLGSSFLGHQVMRALKAVPPQVMSYRREFMRNYPLQVDLLPYVMDKIKNGTEIPFKKHYPHNYTYLHRPDKCKFYSHKGGKLAILVKSAAQNWYRRHTVRTTWAKIHPGVIKVVFLVAYNKSIQSMVDYEADFYKDIVQENFQDAYFNNTLKTVMAFNWAMESCSGADYYLFVDDDHFVNVPGLVQFIKSLSRDTQEQLFLGFLIACGEPERAEHSKWRISFELYPFDLWPPYLAGGAFVTSYSVAQKLQLAFPYVKPIGIDDAYLGIVAKKLALRPMDSVHFHTTGPYATYEYFIHGKLKANKTGPIPHDVLSFPKTECV
ncbi:beta-1,3-galactosyltransferase brn-like [Mizuhopecten yessoensis]|uniref:Hexosyltransferase n=1 Tax=Mizuhopecten yessoensis TaxID=6573 RepID=A0A210QI68_MIZYE|nr:beta-1,3-galactosyltransferase brn-like [Mizuhopecten yessoensis]XP_021357790.1 beta-1,3-galactosyltransferase brn-like [Mizuhopecten yessoensis]XP_021357791.1 beta-1,3-galactosyltransferase brn-like [Mizuhopecten yessoensis]XP_021357792.1 beta-1,3-galactosyltransferase brn-like [Mizuhopecten yessoensis]XP_021357793.1 beta-1,3-galactosyltransferase brn-like [Mizuhopecten yessoensis]OWF48291.1 Beta-1,3-galactosyltransferase brn [Mizuhopecten yessoensis]